MAGTEWLIFQLSDLKGDEASDGVRFHEFLRTPSMSCAVYQLPVGSRDMQAAHEEDELYLVLEGRGRLRVGGRDHTVEPGTLMYVRAACDHTFFEIEEDLTLLTFFGAAPGRSPFTSR